MFLEAPKSSLGMAEKNYSSKSGSEMEQFQFEPILIVADYEKI